MQIMSGRSTHSQRLENWLGAETVERLSFSMKDWYGPPIAVQGVPGAVFACKGGDFRGHVDAGQFGSKLDRAEDIARRLARMARARVARGWKVRRSSTLYAGFASLSDMIAKSTAGKRREYHWNKTTGAAVVVSACNSYWAAGAQPAAGAIGSAAPGGRATDDATAGAMPIDNVSTDTRHIVSGYATCNVANQLLLYDRLFDVAKNMNSAVAESVTGVPTRYQSSTVTNPDYAGGNFAFPEVITTIAATAHNWDAMLYRNQAGTDAQSAPLVAGISGATATRLDLPLNNWFMPLAAGDTGVMDLNSMKLSAAVATGTADWVVGHPLAWMPCPVANLVCLYDYIGTAFNLIRIFDDACMSWLSVNATATTQPTFNMGVTAVHG